MGLVRRTPCTPSGPALEKLPEDVTSEILSRLPVETKLDCKHVCITWRKLLGHVKVGTFSVVGFEDHKEHNNVRFFYTDKAHDGFNLDGEIDVNKQYPWYEISRYNRKCRNVANWFDNDIIVGSCNGLVCMAIVMFNICNGLVCMAIVMFFNPSIPYDFITLPPIRTSIMDDGRLVVSGFGYAPSTDKYKVIRVYYSDSNDPYVGRVEVYTIGSGYGRRRKRKLRYRLCDSPGVLVDGALHWLDYKQRRIIAFDLVTEKFRDTLLPPCFWLFEVINPSDNFQLHVLGGDLCLKNRGKHSDIWVLKKKEGTVDKYVWVWSKVKGHSYEPFAITRNSKLLLRCYKYIFLCYNLMIATFSKLSDYEYIEQVSKDVKYYQAIPHIKSSVSVVALEGKVQAMGEFYTDLGRITWLEPAVENTYGDIVKRQHESKLEKFGWKECFYILLGLFFLLCNKSAFVFLWSRAVALCCPS